MTERAPEYPSHTLSGIAVSPGYAIGRAHFVDRRRVKVPHHHLDEGQIEAEKARLASAFAISEQQITELKQKLANIGDEHHFILDAHQMILRDPMLVDETIKKIEEEHLNAEWALEKVLVTLQAVFDNLDDEYFRERRSDVGFVGDRLQRNLLGRDQPSLDAVTPGSIVVAHDLAPADTALLMKSAILGFVTEAGGKTNHTAIMARSLELPAVVAIDGLTDSVGTGDVVIIDGVGGALLVNPTPSQVQAYQNLKANYDAQKARLDDKRMDHAETRDGVRIRVEGNIELPEETAIVLDHGAEGVGLYRTEFLFMGRKELPGEEEQYEHYRAVVERSNPFTATIRTLDIGGEKLAQALPMGAEANPVMGLRAIRLCLNQEDVFKAQLRALLRASAHGAMRIMFPLISSLKEVRAVRRIFEICRDEVADAGHPMAENIPLGIMIEVPAAALIADRLANEVDFFSIGTNDLAQYTLAVDRGNQHVAHLYAPLHPAMLNLIERVVVAADQAGIEVNMCGEMAGEPLCLPILLGLGLRRFSMNPTSIPLLKSMVRAMNLGDCRSIFEEVQALGTHDEIEACLREALSEMLEGTLAKSIIGPMMSHTPSAVMHPPSSITDGVPENQQDDS